jgi:hypothetical protein
LTLKKTSPSSKKASCRGQVVATTRPSCKIIALRKRDSDDIAEEEAVMEMYKRLACDLDQGSWPSIKIFVCPPMRIGPSSTSSGDGMTTRP